MLKTLLGLGLVAAAVGSSAHTKGPHMPWGEYAELCSRWASTWGIPPRVLEVIGILESSLHPKLMEVDDPRASAKGGAWGLFQMTLDTARSLMKAPAVNQRPEARLWDGSGQSLLDPELNAMLASFYLSRLWKRYGGQVLPTIAAYEQGHVTVDHVVTNGGNLITDLPPHGREYVSRALETLAHLAAGEKAAA